MQLGVGEALVSFLDDKGIPGIVERAMICPPHSQIGPITPEQRAEIIKDSVLAGVYETAVDRESAYEKLKGKVAASNTNATDANSSDAGWLGGLGGAGTAMGGVLGTGNSRRGDTVVQAMVKSAARTMGSTVGRQLIRGILGSLMGGSKR